MCKGFELNIVTWSRKVLKEIEGHSISYFQIFSNHALNYRIWLLVILRKNLFEKLKCGRLSENIDATLADSVSSEEVECEKMLSVNVEVLVNLLGKSIWGKELRVY